MTRSSGDIAKKVTRASWPGTGKGPVSLASTALEGALEPLDWIRVRALRSTMPLSSYFAGRRAERVALLGALSIGLSLLGTAAAPLWMLALGPIVLGVPHLLADLRYCVIRPRWHRRPALWVGVGLPLLAIGAGADMAVGFAAVAGACAGVEGQRWRRVLAVALAALAALAVSRAGPSSTLVLLHLHNFVAVLLWWRWRERGVMGLIPLAAFVGGSTLIALGGLDGLLESSLAATPTPAGLDLGHHLRALAPGLDGALGLRLVLLFTFAQSVHYVIWLRLVPEDDRDRPTPRTFKASWRALQSELGPALPWLALALTLALICAALVDLAAARADYLRLARFHLFLELAVLASLWVSGRRFLIPSQSRTDSTHEPA